MLKRKKKIHEKIDEERAQKEKDWNFYMHIWRKRKHDSEISGKWLGPEPLTTFFHHILEKSLYSEFRYLEENIILVSWEEHDNLHFSSNKYEIVNEKREELLKLWETNFSTSE